MRQRIAAIPIVLLMAGIPMARGESGKDIVKASGVKGGLVVHVGCGQDDGKLTAELCVNDRYLVHGLDTDPKNVEKARKHIRSLPGSIYGRVSVDSFDGRGLPYIDNLVNLVVISDGKSGVPADEVMRVLVPDGVAYVRQGGGGWKKTIKPRPGNIDEWTHFLHGADGNAVANDTVVGPPRHIQWLEKPLWSRHHDLVPVVSALVSTKGRMFYIVNEAPAGIGGGTPGKWFLVARDAFNGVVLWKRPMTWGWKEWSLIWKARFNQPNNVPKRLTAVGDRVYVTLGFNAPLTALDAAGGQIVKTYKGTDFTDEILYQEGTLILSVNQAAQEPGSVADAPPVKKSIMALNAETGKVLWKTGSYVGTSSKTGSVERVTHLLLAARGKGVFLADSDTIVALDIKTGKELWKAPRPAGKRYTSRYEHLMSDMCTLVAADGVVFFCQLEPVQKRIGWGVIKASLTAFSAETGKKLWSRVCGNWGHFCVPDVFVAKGQVWVHDYKGAAMVGLDPMTGKGKSRLSTERWFEQGHHHRCYRNRATESFILTGYRGIEFLDLKSGTHTPHHWTRGECRFGVVPCNGLIYVTPHPCDCYITAKLNGLYALAPKRRADSKSQTAPAAPKDRLVKGPAYGEVSNPQSEDWPTYRGNARRSGSTKTPVPTGLKLAWKARIGNKLSAPTIAGGRVFVSSVDANTLYALNGADGRTAWTFTAGGRIDSPPTIHKGRVLFGSADGKVYCLRASDGKLVWRLQTGPGDRRMVAYGRLESVWPVHGSVLVKDGSAGKPAAYFTAGRSSYLDGGIYVYSADPETGKILSQKCIYSPDPKTGAQPLQEGPRDIPGALSDILVTDGSSVFMRKTRVGGVEAAERKDSDYVWSTAGFLDDSWFNRTTWAFGPVSHSRFLVFDETTVYGFEAFTSIARWRFFHPGQGYALFATDRKAVVETKQGTGKKRARRRKRAPHLWRVTVPIRATGMVLAARTLFIAGAPDVIKKDDPWAAFEGRTAAALWAVSAADGKKLAEYKLDAPPVFDGIAAASGRLYVVMADGGVCCFAEKK